MGSWFRSSVGGVFWYQKHCAERIFAFRSFVGDSLSQVKLPVPLVIGQISMYLNLSKVNLIKVTKHESRNQKESFTIQNMKVEICSGTGES